MPPLITGSFVVLLAIRAAVAVTSSIISYAFGGKIILSHYWVKQTERHTYNAPKGHVIIADPIFET